MAQTKITQLQAAICDRDDKIKIMSLRIKALEDPEFSNLRAQYFTPAPGNPACPPTVPGDTVNTSPGNPVSPPTVQGNTAHRSPGNVTSAPNTSSHSPCLEQVLTELSSLKHQFTALQEHVTKSIAVSNVQLPAPSLASSANTAPLGTDVQPNTPADSAPGISVQQPPVKRRPQFPPRPPKLQPYPPHRQHPISPWTTHQTPAPAHPPPGLQLSSPLFSLPPSPVAPCPGAPMDRSGSHRRWLRPTPSLPPASLSIQQLHPTATPSHRGKPRRQTKVPPTPSSAPRPVARPAPPRKRQPGGLLGGAPAICIKDVSAHRVARANTALAAPSSLVETNRNTPASVLQEAAPLPPPAPLSRPAPLGPQPEAVPDIATSNRFNVLSDMSEN